MEARALPLRRGDPASPASASGSNARLGPRNRRSREHLVAFGKALAHQAAVAVAVGLMLGVLDGFAERGERRIGLARGGESSADGPGRSARRCGYGAAVLKVTLARAVRPRMRPMRSSPSSACSRKALEILPFLAVIATSMVALRLESSSRRPESGVCGAQYMPKQLRSAASFLDKRLRFSRSAFPSQYMPKQRPG